MLTAIVTMLALTPAYLGGVAAVSKPTMFLSSNLVDNTSSGNATFAIRTVSITAITITFKDMTMVTTVEQSPHGYNNVTEPATSITPRRLIIHI